MDATAYYRDRPKVLPHLSVFRAPDYLHEAYGRMVVISHRRHLDGLDLLDDHTLIVSTDWLAWRQALAAGAHCIHIEALLDSWPSDRGDPLCHHLQACEWVYDTSGEDMTLFDGVSLGKYFVRDVTLFATAYHRIHVGLSRAIEKYRPHLVRLVDLRGEYDIIDDIQKCDLVASVAAQQGITCVIALDAPAPAEGGFSERNDGHGAPAPDALWRRTLRDLYAILVDAMLRLDWLARDRPPGVYVYSSPLTILGMIAAHERTMGAPVFLAAVLPKSLQFIASCWRKGIRLVRQREVRLSSAELPLIVRIEARLSAAEAAAAPHSVEAAIRKFVRCRIVESGWLAAVACEVKSCREMLRRNAVTRVVVGDVTGRPRLIAECAASLGLPSDELPNGCMVVPQRNDARCGDRGRGPLLDRVLTWGWLTERWLALGAAKVRYCRTGYPALDRLRRAAAKPLPTVPLNALVLPIYADGDDVIALTSNIFGYLAETIEVLHAAGIANIRIKVHGGPQNIDYYRDVADGTGIRCEVVKEGPLAPHLEWADLVVGPVNSGAFIEANALGVCYYGYRPWPSLIDVSLFEGMDILSTPAELAAALAARRIPDRAFIVSRVASFDSIDNAGRHTWRALAESAPADDPTAVLAPQQE